MFEHILLYLSERTAISQLSVDLTVRVSTNVTLRCVATTDPAETAKLKLQWHFGDERLIASSPDDGRVRVVAKNDDEILLIFNSVLMIDSGNYSCWASNGLDVAVKTTSLIVQGIHFVQFH